MVPKIKFRSLAFRRALALLAVAALLLGQMPATPATFAGTEVSSAAVGSFAHTPTLPHSLAPQAGALAVTKRLVTPANRNVLLVGEMATFQIVVTNTGTTPIVYLPQEDQFDDACLTFVPKADPVENASSPNNLQWADLTLYLGHDMAPGEAFTSTVNFAVTGVAANSYNSALFDGAVDANNATVPPAGHTVSFDCVQPARIGDRVYQDLNGNGVDNGEPGLSGVVVRLTQPGGAVITTTTSITGYYSFPMLPPGAYTVTVDAATVPSGYVLTTANLPLPVTLTAGQNYDTADFGYQVQADLAISKVGTPNPVVVGDTVTYTLVITNNGPAVATGVKVTDTLPAGLDQIAIAASQGSCGSPNPFICSLGTLAVGATARITVTGRATTVTTLPNTAAVGGDQVDPTPGNNSAAATLTAVTTSLIGVVTDSLTGQPLPGATVVVTDSQGHVYTTTADATGRYTFTNTIATPLSSGAATVSGSAPGYGTTTQPPTIVAGTVNNQDLQLPPTILQGIVYDQGTGVPIVGATVVVTDSGGHVYTVTTGAGGWYTITSSLAQPLDPGIATVTGSAASYQTNTVTTTPPTIVAGAVNQQDVPLGTTDLAVTKDDGQVAVQPGELVTYTVSVVNNGSITAASVVLTDVLPAYTTYVSDTSGIAPTVPTAGTYVWNVGSLAPAGSFSFALVVRVSSSLPDGTTSLPNTVSASTTSPEKDVTNNTTQDVDTVTAHPNLTLFKSATVNSVPVLNNGTVTYTLTGDNRGFATATGAVITDVIDANTTYNAGSAVLEVNGGIVPGLVVTYTDATKTLLLGLPDIPPGAAGHITFTVHVTSSLPVGTLAITNTATVGLNELDSDYSNNSDSVTLSTLAGVDLWVQKYAVAEQTPAVPGSQIFYTLQYGNKGSSTGTSVVLTDVLAANTTFVSATGGGVYNGGTGVISWTLGTLVPGASGIVSFTVQILDALPAGVTAIPNTASIAGAQTDLLPADNQSSTSTPVTAQPNLAVTKSDGKTTALAGELLVYTIAYSNTGNQTATGVVISDTLLANLTFLFALPAQAAYDPASGVITWTVASLAVDGPHSLTLYAQVNSAALAGQLAADRVGITDDGANGPDPDLSNNSATDSDVIVRPYIVLEKSVTGPAYVGGQITYTIGWYNDGAATADNVVITDTLPANTTLVPGSITAGGVYNAGTRTITWNLGPQAGGASGAVGFAVTVNAGAGGALQAAATLSTETATGSVVVTSTAASIARPFCDFAGCSAFKGLWQGADPVGPAGWNDNPRLPTTSFSDASWSAPQPAFLEAAYWTAAANLSAEWMAMTTTTQYAPNYSFFRQNFCLPLNAGGISASLEVANDDKGDLYLNGVYLGQKSGSGAADTFDASAGIQAGINLLAVRLLNNDHGGHPALYPPNGDHEGLIFNLNASYTSLHPFASAPAVVLAGQAVTFSVDDQALGGRRPFSYTVSFGDSQSADYQLGSTFTHTYAAPGVYTATVTARAALGCTGVDQVVVNVLPADGNLIANRAGVSYANVIGTAYSGQTGAGIEVTPDLAISKSDAPDPVNAGSLLTYTLLVTNTGAVAHSVFVSDTLPGGVTFSSATAGCAEATGVVNCPLGNLAAGATRTLTVTVLVSPAFSGTLTNIATLFGSETDPTPANNTASQPTTVNTLADLSVTKTGSPSPVVPGRVLTYTLVVVNDGPSDAQNVTVTDTLPAGVTLLVADPSQGSCVAAVCSLGTLAAGASATITVTVTVHPDTIVGPLSNTATVGSTTADPDGANNSATIQTPVAPEADLRISKSDGPDPVTAGTTLTYTLVVTNAGPSYSANTTVTDTLPAGVTFVSATPGQGSGPNPLVWNLGTLAVNESRTLTVVVTVNSGTTGQLINNATVGSDATDPTPGNSAAQAATNVTAAADLVIAKSDFPDPVAENNPLTYTLTITNNGPSDAVSVRVTDTLPVSVTFGSASGSGWTCGQAAGVVTCTDGTLVAGGVATITVGVTVLAGAPNSIVNTAQVGSSTADPTSGNNTASQATQVYHPALAIAKTPDVQLVHSGGAVTFTIAVTNTGDVTLTNVAVSDPLATSCARSIGQLTVGETQSYTCAVTATNDFTNTATVVGAPPAASGGPVSASDTARVLLYVAIGDRTCVDANHSNVCDAGDLNVGNALLRITGVTVLGAAVDITVTTSYTGYYLVDNLAPGVYSVTAPASHFGFSLVSTVTMTTSLPAGGGQDLGLDFLYAMPTASDVVGLTAAAEPASGGVRLRWTLRPGAMPEGFLIYRAERSAGPYKQITPEPLPATPDVLEYDYLDQLGVFAGQVYWYRLQALPAGGAVGPVASTPAYGYRSFMPTVTR